MIRRPPRSTLSLHDALPISASKQILEPEEISENVVEILEDGVVKSLTAALAGKPCMTVGVVKLPLLGDRKSTRLNSSHGYISYAVFCLKKKKNTHNRSVWRA